MFKKKSLNKAGLRAKRPRSQSPDADTSADTADTALMAENTLLSEVVKPSSKLTSKSAVVSASSSSLQGQDKDGKSGIFDDTTAKASTQAELRNTRDQYATAQNVIDGKLDSSTTDADISASKGDGAGEVYRGQANYTQYIEKRESTLGNKANIGPVRASSNIRVTCRFDYQPDICKDYKQTGYCGYGDSCIFLHDRGDYKAGWQIDKEWEAEQRKLREARLNGELNSDDDNEDVERGGKSKKQKKEELPFACLICRKEFRNPVVTKCGHYFCEACAMKRFKTTPKCHACGANTNGIFNVAKDLMAKIKEREMRATAAS